MESATRDSSSSSTAQPRMVCAVKINLLRLPGFTLCRATPPPPVLVQNSDLRGSSTALCFPAEAIICCSSCAAGDYATLLQQDLPLYPPGGGRKCRGNDCYGRLGERGEGMNRGSVQIKTETGEEERETAVVLAELLAHNACTCCCKRSGGGG